MMNCTVFYKEIADKSNKINAEEHKSHYKERIAAYHHKKAGIKSRSVETYRCRLIVLSRKKPIKRLRGKKNKDDGKSLRAKKRPAGFFYFIGKFDFRCTL